MSPTVNGSVSEVAVIRPFVINMNKATNCLTMYYFPLVHKNSGEWMTKISVQQDERIRQRSFTKQAIF